jgi:putative Mg2+ transporter-C (MgtC) family protein
MQLELSDMFSLIAAVIMGALIGFERAINGKPAGLRTNIVICLGAAMFTLIIGNMSQEAPDAMSRVMAGIITGVGFLGAGVLIQDNTGIHGLTTAATIWLVASVGVACGAVYYLMAGFVNSITVAILFGLSPLTKKLKQN